MAVMTQVSGETVERDDIVSRSAGGQSASLQDRF
jgi:hypothetical protein